MRSFTRRSIVITVVSAALLVAGLAMSVVAFGQGTDTTPLSEYTSTTPTLTQPTQEPTQTAEPTQTETTESLPTQTSEPTSTTSTPAPEPEELAFTGYDPLIAAGLGVALMLGAVALQRRRSRSQN